METTAADTSAIWWAVLAETFGTFALVFAGTVAVVDKAQTGALGHDGVELTFQIIVILGTVVGAKRRLLTGVGIRGVVAFEALMGSPASGALMNSACPLSPMPVGPVIGPSGLTSP